MDKREKMTMILEKRTFDELPDAMQMHILYCDKQPVEGGTMKRKEKRNDLEENTF